MKQVKKVYGHFDLIKRSGENMTKVSYSSLEKYTKSPYLQRVVQHSQRKQMYGQHETAKEYRQEESQGLSSKQQQIKTKNLNINQLPKLATPIKFKQPQVRDHFKAQSIELPKTKTQLTTHPTTLQMSSIKSKKLEPLQKVNRIHYVTKTKAGTTGKQTKINQDVALVELKLPFGLKLFGVFDGHGLNGHSVSAYIKVHLIKNLNSALKKIVNSPSLAEMKSLIETVFLQTNQDLLECEINTELSGSTVICIFIYADKILSFNVGDSRAIVIKQIYSHEKSEPSEPANLQNLRSIQFRSHQNVDYEWHAIPLSIDHKPERQDQKERILKFGGRIFSQKSEKGQVLGPLRVWMKEVAMPGLAMTRSFGDKAGIKAGTMGEPEILQFDLTDEQKMIVVASDGIWEYLENDEVMTLVLPFYLKGDLDMAGERLLKICCEIWHKVSYSRDDITFILVSLNHSRK